MSCIPSCLLGAGFIGSKLYMMFGQDKYGMHHDFMSTLDDKQRSIYKGIVQERMKIYLQGMTIGTVLATIVLLCLYNKKIKNSLICLFIVIYSSVTYAYYTLSTKSTYMINHLDRPEQVNAWLKIYKTYKFNHTFGFVLGIIGYFIIVNSLL
jgi:hypothetical protein